MNTENSKHTNGRIAFRITVCLAIILAGVVTMLTLKGMKKPPVEIPIEERSLRVDITTVKPENVGVQISGFGQVTSVKRVTISAEVPGRVTFTNPSLDQGEVIIKGASLFKVDSSDYNAVLDSAIAEVNRAKQNIQLIKKQLELDSARLIVIERNRDLSKADYERQRKLYDNEMVGSLSDVEKLERTYNSAIDQAAQMAKAIDLYPLQVAEVEESLAAANSRLKVAQTNIERCDVKAPFTGRIAAVSVESGQYVSPGQALLTLADDSILEIPVSIDSIEAKKWLRFKPGRKGDWLQDVEPVDCKIRWVEDKKTVWHGVLHRVMKFDPATRTITVAVRVNKKQVELTQGMQLPLVEGMFCSITIPGRAMEHVYRLPRWAVSFKNTVFLAVNNRLRTVHVEVERTQDEETFVSSGLKNGDQVITTRLVEPLENSILKILNQEVDKGASGDKK